MMRVRDEASDNPKDGKWFDFEVRSSGDDTGLIECYVGVVFLVNVEVFDEALSQKVIKSSAPFFQMLTTDLVDLIGGLVKRRTSTVICSVVTFDL